MGKSRSYEIIEFRKLIMNQIVQSKELVKLLDDPDSSIIKEAKGLGICFGD